MASLVRSIDLDRPVEDVYERWSRLERLPQLLDCVQSVERLDERRTHWVVRIRGEVRHFDAETTEDEPNLRLAWRATGATPHTGTVDFHRLGAGRSRITVQLDWEPSGLFDTVGNRLGLVARAVDADLERFRDRLGAVPAGPTIDLRDDAGEPGGAAEAGDPRGRSADRPTDIPAKGWLQVLKRTVKQLKSDNVPIVSGGVAYYSFLALVPALAAVVSIYGLVAEPSDVGRQLNSFFGALPKDAAQLLRSQVRAITAQQAGGLGTAAAIGIVGSLWSASKGMQALISSLNIAYDEEETRKGLRLRAITLGMTVGLAVVATAVIAAMVVAGSLSSHLPTAGQWAVSVARWPVLFVVLTGGLAVLYRYAPDRDEPEWRWVSPGALLAAALLVLGSFGFALYVNAFGSYSETYGSLGAIVVLLLWLNLTAYVVVLGAELDAELERQTAKDTTEGADQPLGTRDAYAADTVAA
jgi:membrane protein